MKKRVKKQNKKKDKSVVSVLFRYLVLVVFGIFLYLFYKIFLPLTIWPVYYLLNLFYDISISGNFLIIDGFTIEIIEACVAGFAYYFLLILNLTTKMKNEQRLYSLLFSFSSLLILNILRIFLLSILLIERFVFFDVTHKLFWYVLSIVFVIGIWFLTVLIFKIKKIPVYSDLKNIIKDIKKS